MALVFYENLGVSPSAIRWAKTSQFYSSQYTISFSSNGSQIITWSWYYGRIIVLSSLTGDVQAALSLQIPSGYIIPAAIKLTSDSKSTAYAVFYQ
ncbi:hypothetical protein FGO68_gene16747 [Halteria grandinella]|uniref:Uncharacterized protein n=1 Tax=Halteria grandinella TaxID=5974 RepID=A0A8J8NEU8_HALGN|nr:hypothetical protein FGO68_gene16747 [Halteria grandinella]